MPERSLASGGLVRPPAPFLVRLDDAECVVNARGECYRADQVHLAHHEAGTADSDPSQPVEP